MSIEEVLAERDEYEKRTGSRYSYGVYYGMFVAGRPKDFQRSPTVKYTHRVHHGISGTARIAKKFTDEELMQIKEEYLAGSTTTAIAEKFGCAAPTVRKRLREMGVFDSTRDYGTMWTEEEIEQLRELYLKGFSAAAIAEIMNRSKKAVAVKISHSGFVQLKKRLKKEKDR